MRSVSSPPFFRAALLALCLAASGLCFSQGVFLNEVDSDSNTVPDSTEFVESIKLLHKDKYLFSMHFYIQSFLDLRC